MDDASIEATAPKRDYTAAIYAVVQRALVAKAEELGGQWTADDVSRALWVHATSSKLKQGDAEDTPKKRKKAEKKPAQKRVKK